MLRSNIGEKGDTHKAPEGIRFGAALLILSPLLIADEIGGVPIGRRGGQFQFAA